ncbi:arginyltransferase [Sphingorhabdus lutea]|uniref:Aspartate/glutamate leucyltransferase n=1 Tax=Sphingorhabdus lutea TaxID=1913578 RepID=A0A1L3JDT7_9SPHN|nr:arginyltransferase [Sphingorhabdus lutea]APG63213.1 arginyltransferase [Sphingorhabdus lutea]
MTAPVKFPRFFLTSPAACPYLPDRTERKMFTDLSGDHANELNDALGRIGFRRSQNVAYRPSCEGCKACISVRVLANEFRPNATQRKIMRRNDDVVATACKPWSTSEQYNLMRLYLEQRHPDGGMNDMDDVDFADMIEQTTVTSYVIEYRLPSHDADGNALPHGGELIGACLTDQQGDGLSMIYSFYNPLLTDRSSLGSYIILDHIDRAAKAGLDYVYLGYWVKGSPRMQYKTRYKPMEMLGPDGWYRAE